MAAHPVKAAERVQVLVVQEVLAVVVLTDKMEARLPQQVKEAPEVLGSTVEIMALAEVEAQEGLGQTEQRQ